MLPLCRIHGIRKIPMRLWKWRNQQYRRITTPVCPICNQHEKLARMELLRMNRK